MRRESDLRRVDVYRDAEIMLDVKDSTFTVPALELTGLANVAAARHALDVHVKERTKVVRRKVWCHEDYYNRTEAECWTIAEITSFRFRDSGVRAIVMQDGNREEFDVDDVFEDTPENQASIDRLIAIKKEVAKLEDEYERRRKSMKAVVAPKKSIELGS